MLFRFSAKRIGTKGQCLTRPFGLGGPVVCRKKTNRAGYHKLPTLSAHFPSHGTGNSRDVGSAWAVCCPLLPSVASPLLSPMDKFLAMLDSSLPNRFQHWQPVLRGLMSNADGWHALHSDRQGEDPAFNEILSLLQTLDAENTCNSDIDLATLLAQSGLVRRRASIRLNRVCPALVWTPFDGPLSSFAEQGSDSGELRTYYDVLTAEFRIRDELLGRMLVWSPTDRRQAV